MILTVGTWLAATIRAGAATALIGLLAQAPQDIVDQAEVDFAAGRIEASVDGFDRLARLVPEVGPVLWQRGIGLYELGRFDECAAQFAANATVNPTDLENATWHFLCLAQAGTPEAARAALLPAGPDPRVMRTTIFEMVRGAMTPDEVIEQAYLPIRRFYAHLYVGLYLEATGDPEAGRAHIEAAASDDYREYGGFMNVVARVHLARIRSALPRPVPSTEQSR
jgi:lipoprotein NlpI